MTWKRGLLFFAAGTLLLLVGLAVFLAREAERIAVTTPPSAGPLTGSAGGETASPIAAAPGLTAIHQGIRYTVLQIADPEPAGIYPVKPGLRRIGILLRLEPVEAGAACNFASIRLRGSDGVRYGWALASQEPALRIGTLAAGDSVAGWVAYDLPPGVRPAALEYGTAARAEPFLTLP
ncbi:hypothetical protein [Tepidiforma thermophila]|uniref:DUF4352 domain-containing protein n=1 Tax=Tepidiforma thermophila (strain KCTC 52669 / CGMCC 1.13589 / G233) TaxID=2761530 RepID=A0A2A9HA69_TEPT2|nr:hypothetical protein [Tepidiforma thermophila]PFG72824.1 hypothetical protein A9A59_0015 [Tepidiforma thermophila]